MKPPIVVGDDTTVVEIYPSIEAATRQMEAIDVEDGLYRAWDSEGLVLIPTPLPRNRATIIPSEPPEYKPEDLRSELQRTVREPALRLGIPEDWITQASIAELIEALEAAERAWEAVRRERSLMNRLRRLLRRRPKRIRR